MPKNKIKNNTRILLIDIETAPSSGWFFDLWKEGNIVGTIKSWYVLSVAWKWLGEDKVHCKALVDYPHYRKNQKNREDDLFLVQDIHALLEEADVVIGHNADRFDLRKINSRLLRHGFNPPSPYKTLDTLKVSRRYFAMDSNRLNDVAKYLGVGSKLPHTGFKLWEDCMKGDPTAWKLMKKYNIQDVALLERVYMKLRQWSTSHPNVNLVDMREGACPTCGSKKLQRRGFSVTRTTRIQRFHCQGCGAWSVGKSEGRLAIR